MKYYFVSYTLYNDMKATLRHKNITACIQMVDQWCECNKVLVITDITLTAQRVPADTYDAVTHLYPIGEHLALHQMHTVWNNNHLHTDLTNIIALNAMLLSKIFKTMAP